MLLIDGADFRAILLASDHGENSQNAPLRFGQLFFDANGFGSQFDLHANCRSKYFLDNFSESLNFMPI